MSTSDSTQNNEHVTNDPKPPEPNCSSELRAKYNGELNKFTLEWCKEYDEMKALTSDVLWGDFTVDFSPMRIHKMDNTSLKTLRDLLLQHGVYVQTKRGLPRRSTLQACWKA